MTTAELMAKLKKADVHLSVVKDELVIRGRNQLLSTDLLAEIREHKLSLLEFLRDEESNPGKDNGRPDSQELIPLVELTKAEIEEIAKSVPGGAVNVQDVYPLAPLQEGFFFHHLLGGEGDTYLGRFLFSFDTRTRLDRYLTALQAVVDRNDILRTAVLWEGLHTPVQVVWRKAQLHIEEVEIDPSSGDAGDQLYARFDPRRLRIDIRQAPLLRLYIAYDRAKNQWLMLMLQHHLVGDHTTLNVMQDEIKSYLLGREDRLPKPLPFRNLVAQVRHGVSQQEHDDFFREMLGDVDEPTTPFGLHEVLGDGSGIEEAHLDLPDHLALRLRASARRLRVSPASLFHVAWAQVLAKASGRANVVFGTVLFGRMQGGEGADRVLGLFINTLPVRINVGKETVAASVGRTHVLLAELMRHEHASLVLAQRCSGLPTSAPLFSSILNYRYVSEQVLSEESLQAWEGIKKLRFEERTNYPLMFSVNDHGRGFSLDAQAPVSVGPMRVCEFMRTALESLADALDAVPSTAAHSIEVLPASERHQLLYEWNDTKVDYSAHENLCELFEAQVRKNPNVVSVVFGDASLSYAELDKRANQLAHHLKRLGIGPEMLVGVCLERSLDMVVAVLAILKAGAAYVPLDPAFPENRLSYMVEDSRMSMLLTHRGLEQNLEVRPPEIVRLDSDWSKIAKLSSTSDGLPPSSGHNRAYVLYTSGSTGKPKGVEIPHSAIVNFLLSMQQQPGFRATDAMLAVTTLSFDIAGLELYLPLITGGKVIIASREDTHDPLHLMKLLRESGSTMMQATPATWRSLIGAGWEGSANLKVLCGGEALPTDLAEALLARCGELWNMYGPTETTVWSTVQKVVSASGSVPIGKPIANTQLYVLDAARELVPQGVIGELYIAGDGLARGYLNREELTRERFVPNPFNQGTRMYSTGDLARWLPDGTVECLGRVDNQVKIRGFRIELGEIEARLAEHSAVREAVVIAREDTPGDKRLVAYYTPSLEGEPKEGASGAEQFRLHLSTSLPEYMVPAAYVRMNSFPLTPNGKLDRKALPSPEADSYSARKYEPPQGELEQKLAAIWAEVLKLNRVGRQDNFFDLGGHSLLAVQLLLQLQQIIPNEDMPLRAVLEAPTVKEFAVWLQNRKENQEKILVQVRQGDDSRIPFFCVHGAGGNVLSMRSLAMALPADLPVYFLQAKGLDGSEPFDSVEETARFYVDEIRKVQPHGPYQLGGGCYGGLVAFEMARLLEQSGEPIAALFLIDSFNNAYPKFLSKREVYSLNLKFLVRRLALHSRKIPSLQPNEWRDYMRVRVKALNRFVRSLVGRIAEVDANEFQADLDWERAQSAAGTRLGEILERVGRASRLAGIKYVPKPYHGDAVIVRARERRISPYNDDFLGWKPVVLGAIEELEVEADHMTLFEDPAVQKVAAAIESKLSKSSAEAGNPHAYLYSAH